MPQSGFHGLVGLATARALVRRVPDSVQTGFVFGAVLGAVLPDIDLYPAAIGVLMKVPDAVKTMHRTASHSIFVVLILALLGALLASKPKWRWVCWGLAIGILTHEVLDIFLLFASIDIMWPLSHLPQDGPLFKPINIWVDEHVGLSANIRDAFEFPAFALMLMSLRKIVLKQRGDGKDMKVMKVCEGLLWAYFLVALVTAFTVSQSMQQMIINFPCLLLIIPYSWSRIWVYRGEITQWARQAPAEVV